MRRVAPSTIVREEIDEIFADAVAPETNILSALAQLGVRYVVQQGLEQEQTDHLGRGRYERGAGTRGRRNGYEDGSLRTAEGKIGVKVPQVRDSDAPYASKLIGPRKQSSTPRDSSSRAAPPWMGSRLLREVLRREPGGDCGSRP